VFGGALDGELWRYDTEDKARGGHEWVVTLVRLEYEQQTQHVEGTP
jgi:hypothetical protein